MMRQALSRSFSSCVLSHKPRSMDRLHFCVLSRDTRLLLNSSWDVPLHSSGQDRISGSDRDASLHLLLLHWCWPQQYLQDWRAFLLLPFAVWAYVWQLYYNIWFDDWDLKQYYTVNVHFVKAKNFKRFKYFKESRAKETRWTGWWWWWEGGHHHELEEGSSWCVDKIRLWNLKYELILARYECLTYRECCIFLMGQYNLDGVWHSWQLMPTLLQS